MFSCLSKMFRDIEHFLKNIDAFILMKVRSLFAHIRTSHVLAGSFDRVDLKNTSLVRFPILHFKIQPLSEFITQKHQANNSTKITKLLSLHTKQFVISAMANISTILSVTQ